MMNKYFFWLIYCIIVIIMSACSRVKVDDLPVTIELNQGWEFRPAGTEQWYAATVPGCVHTDLGNNQLIPDPFYRLNERDLQWIDKMGWEYRIVIVPDRAVLNRKNIELVFEGLDTYADVYLNDVLLLQTDNMFRTYKTEIKQVLKEGENVLLIHFRSPTLTGLEKLEAYGFQLAADNDQSEAGGMGDKRVSPYVRKAPYHFGWDWGPRLVTSGIWRPVKLVSWDEVKIEDIHVKTLDINDVEAKLSVSLRMHVVRPGEKRISVFVDNREMLSETWNLEPGTWNPEHGITHHELLIKLDSPERWWPNGMGSQKLYNLRVEVRNGNKRVDYTETSIGLRTAELVRGPDDTGDGESFYFRVNGKPVFAKGANYIPNDVFLNRVTPENYEYVVKSAADAHMNMLRVWGGGIYENDLFYDLCDRYGIMVWQDFMFACAMYPGNDEFLESVRLEAVDNVRRLRHHPSLVLWCGNNEIEAAWGPYDENRGWGWKHRYDANQRDVIWKAYDTLFHHILPEVIAMEDPGRPYWHSSPSAGMGKLASYESTSGDMHYWGVWHGEHPFSDFRKYRARFMSEYGFQSFPEFSSVKRFTLPEDHDIESEVMMAHQRSGIGNLRIRQYMKQDYIVPSDFEAFLYVSQLLQAEAISTAIGYHRADMPWCMGSLYWQLNDCWPAASWSGIDYYGRWKALHYFVREAYKPIKQVVTEDGQVITLHMISDTYSMISARIDMRLVNFDGEILWAERGQADLPPGLKPTILELNRREVLKDADIASVVLVTSLMDPSGLLDRNYHYFAKPKDLKLKDPELRYEITDKGDTFEVRLETTRLAKNIFLTAGEVAGQFSDNFFDIIPGEIVSVNFPKTTTIDEFERSLNITHLQATINH